MKKYIIILILIAQILSGVGVSKLKAQQLQHYSQYMFNDYVFNPAISGIHKYFQAKSNNRYQWAGIVDAPRTYILSVYGPHATHDMGYGGYIFSDVTGPTSRMGVYLSYGYNILIQNDIRLSMGLAGGILQYKIDGSKIILYDEMDDPAMTKSVHSDYLSDANFGLYLYSPDYFVGFSACQLFNNKVKFKNLQLNEQNRLKTHFFLTAGYRYNIDKDFDIEPSIMLKAMAPTPLQLDINAKVIYQKLVWLGVSYRTHDAVAILVGYNYQDKFYFGYSYDITTSTIKNYSTGTHEIMISARFNTIKQSMSKM